MRVFISLFVGYFTTVPVMHNIQRQMTGEYELERMWKDGIVF
jgi:hypothetical protein